MSAVSVCVWASTCLVGSVSISGPGWKVSLFLLPPPPSPSFILNPNKTYETH